MAIFNDLDRCDYFGPTESLLAIGWLDRARGYSTGPVAAEFFKKLVSMLQDPWSPVAFAGSSGCPLCSFTRGPAHLRYMDIQVSLGSNVLFVPTKDIAYVAPSMIAHYVDAHCYQPPNVFQEAVMDCPEMRSRDYLKAVMSLGIHKLRGAER